MRVRAPIILVSLPLHLKRKRRDLLFRHVGIAGRHNLSAVRFLGAGIGSLPQTLLNCVQL